jgi:outer membrane immunogenic protein
MYPGGSPAFYFGASSFTVKTTWDASIRGRLGFLLVPNVLLYGTAGVSWLHVEATSNCDATGPDGTCAPNAPLGAFFSPPIIANSTARPGWTLGAGFEVNLWGRWLVRSEYRYADYGTWENTDSRTCTGVGLCRFMSSNSGAFFVTPGSTATVAYAMRLQSHIAKLGLAYKFN